MKWIVNIIRILFLGLFLYLVLTGNMFLVAGYIRSKSDSSYILWQSILRLCMCPMNTVMIPIEWISKKLKNTNTGKTPKWLKKGILPWFALGISVVIAMILSKKALHINLPILLIVWLAISILVTLTI